VIIFLVSLIGIVPLAERLGWCTEQMSLYTNETVAGLLNCTMGNVPELVLVLITLGQGELAVLQDSLLGGVISNGMLVTGLVFTFGGLRHKTMYFKVMVSSIFTVLLMLGALAIGIARYVPTARNDENDNLYFPAVDVSRGMAVLLVLVYGLVIFFQLATHKEEFDDDSEFEQTTTTSISKKSGDEEGEAKSDGGSDDSDDDDEPILGFWGALFWMAVIVTFLSFLTDFMVDAIDGTCATIKVSPSFVTAIIIPNVNNAPEHAVSILLAMKGKMNTALSISVGSAAQLLCFVLPLGVIFGWIINVDLSLQYPALEAEAFIMATLVIAAATNLGKSTWLTGAILLVAYAIVAIGFYTVPVTTNVFPLNTTVDTETEVEDRQYLQGATRFIGASHEARMFQDRLPRIVHPDGSPIGGVHDFRSKYEHH